MTQDTATSAAAATPLGSYELFMLVLCLAALAALAADVTLPVNEDGRAILRWADNALCALFFVDFLISLFRAPDRWRYLRTWGWIDLLSSVPAVDVLRIGRGARIVRILRVLRGVRATKLIASLILSRRADATFLAAALVSLLLMVFAAVAVLHFENVEGANIQGAEDALWWAFVTITTVGYGDRFPVSTEGRLIGAMLMTAGVGLFGTLSGFVAAWFLAPDAAKQESELASLAEEIRLLRASLDPVRTDDEIRP